MTGMDSEMENKDDPDENSDKNAYSEPETPRKDSADGGNSTSNEEEDIYKLLAAKDRDLILAAELGKALLEKNEQLSKRNEEIAEEFSQKLEALEQEKYQLKRQLEAAEEEYQLRLAELQADITGLREALEEHSSTQKIQDRGKAQAVSDLTEQNQRLAEDLRDSVDREKELREHIKRMRSQFSKRRNSMQEHFNQMESLRDEIDCVMNKKQDLEKQIQVLISERESLTSSLETSSRKIMELERKHREQEAIIRRGEREADELRSTNHHLLDKLETLSRSRSSSPSCRMSLQSELELSGSDSEKSLRKQFDVIDEMDEYELDDEDEEMTCQEPNNWLDELNEEVVSAYSQLRNMCALIRQRERRGRVIKQDLVGDSMDTSSSASIPGIQGLRAGQLTNAVMEIKALLHDLMRKESRSSSLSGGCPGCGKSKEEKLLLEQKLHTTMEQVERGNIGLKQAELTAKRQEEQLQTLRSKLELLKTRLSAAEEERTVLKTDLENLSMSRDETIKRAWETRDTAVERKNTAEVELARARIDFMQANSQLLEAVQQKVSLSEQLDDWQADLHAVIDQRLTNSEQEKSTDTENKSGNPLIQKNISKPNNKIISFFQRS